jgi:hypothetical protein
MSKKCFKIVVRFPAVFAAQTVNLLRVGAKNGADFNVRNRAGGTRVRLADISSAYQSNVRSHLRKPKRNSNTTMRSRLTKKTTYVRWRMGASRI